MFCRASFPCASSYWSAMLLLMSFLIMSSVMLPRHVFPHIILCCASSSCLSSYCVLLCFFSICFLILFLYQVSCACSPCVSSYCPQVKISGRNSQGYSQFSRPVSYTTPDRGQLANCHHILISHSHFQQLSRVSWVSWLPVQLPVG